MGLDVSAYKNIKITEHSTDNEELYEMDDEYVNFSIDRNFNNHGDLVSDFFYTFEDETGMCAGSYSGYNNWRDTLAMIAGYEAKQYENYEGKPALSHCVECWDGMQGPFSELINFNDCDGTIATDICKKLAKDFADFQEKAEAYGSANKSLERKWFLDKYNDWREMFEFASENGAVVFH